MSFDLHIDTHDYKLILNALHHITAHSYDLPAGFRISTCDIHTPAQEKEIQQETSTLLKPPLNTAKTKCPTSIIY